MTGRWPPAASTPGRYASPSASRTPRTSFPTRTWLWNPSVGHRGAGHGVQAVAWEFHSTGSGAWRGRRARVAGGLGWLAGSGGWRVRVAGGFAPDSTGGCVQGQRKIRVAVVFGGRSTEHAVSCASAGLILSAIDPDRYEVLPIGIA